MKNLKNSKIILTSGILQKNEPCIIFISLGDISQDFFSDKYGFNFLNVLVGKSHLTLKIDRNTNKLIGSFYSHVENIKKQNGSLINANFFINIDNQHISGILFTDAYMCDLYNKNNTFLFLNPYATNKIKVKDFKDLIYWKSNCAMEYIPRYKGNNLWHNF